MNRRISPVSEDWVKKGFHIHYGRVEIVMVPDHQGGIDFKKFFSATPDSDVEPVRKLALRDLGDAQWRRRLRRTVDQAMRYFKGYEGELQPLARGRLREFRFLAIALDRWEATP